MLSTAVFLLAATAQLATAHFGVEYPVWRANTLAATTNYSQWTYPCAGVPTLAGGNRTDWPLDGGSVKLDMHHKWTYVFINLGLGANVTNFNYTLTQPFWNETGNGTLCVPKLALPVGLTVSDGAEGSIQVVTVGANGNALYNCADITFRSNATTLSTNDCVTDEGVTFAPIAVEAGANGSTTANTTTTTGKSAAATGGVNMIALSSVVGLTLAFVCGMGL